MTINPYPRLRLDDLKPKERLFYKLRYIQGLEMELVMEGMGIKRSQYFIYKGRLKEVITAHYRKVMITEME